MSSVHSSAEPPMATVLSAVKPYRARSLGSQYASRFVRNMSGMVGLAMIVALLVVHLGAPLFTSANPAKTNAHAILVAPNSEHPFGTDQFGRDLFARVLYGGRISLWVATVVTVITTVTGLAIGAVSAYYPRIDGPLMRFMDILMAFPEILLAIGVVAILGPKLSNIMIALVFPVTPRTARIVRSVILSLKEQEFVKAARSTGASDSRIIMRHLVPNSMPALLVRQTFVFGIAILAEGSLNFLGIGVPPEIPTLGSIVSEGRAFLRQMPWFSLYAGLFIAAMVLSVNLLGDGLRDVLDPQMKR
jgi:peptide/nickel transport system permease protein